VASNGGKNEITNTDIPARLQIRYLISNCFFEGIYGVKPFDIQMSSRVTSTPDTEGITCLGADVNNPV
jgi:hypothetical protein